MDIFLKLKRAIFQGGQKLRPRKCQLKYLLSFLKKDETKQVFEAEEEMRSRRGGSRDRAREESFAVLFWNKLSCDLFQFQFAYRLSLSFNWVLSFQLLEEEEGKRDENEVYYSIAHLLLICWTSLCFISHPPYITLSFADLVPASYSSFVDSICGWENFVASLNLK